MTDLYTILGVEKTASQDEIKKAYRKMASLHHPDKGGDTAKFQELQSAYDTLSNEDKRAAHDNPHQFSQSPFGNPFGGNGNFDDMLQNIFGARAQNPVPRNRVLNMQTVITLEEAFHGKELLANITLPSGKTQVVEVTIPPGIHDGTTLRLAGIGDDTHGAIARGDIHLSIRVADHLLFTRNRNDLIFQANIDCVRAMMGTVVQIVTIDGKTLDVNIAAGSQHGEMMSVPNYGMPVGAGSDVRGRLLLKINISVPKNLTDSQKALLDQFFN